MPVSPDSVFPVDPAPPDEPCGCAEPRSMAARAPRGRGTGWQIAHRFERDERTIVDDGWGTLSDELDPLPTPTPTRTEVRLERCGEILARNDSPDLPFEWSINPYRGCEHVM